MDDSRAQRIPLLSLRTCCVNTRENFVSYYYCIIFSTIQIDLINCRMSSQCTSCIQDFLMYVLCDTSGFRNNPPSCTSHTVKKGTESNNTSVTL